MCYLVEAIILYLECLSVLRYYLILSTICPNFFCVSFFLLLLLLVRFGKKNCLPTSNNRCVGVRVLISFISHHGFRFVSCVFSFRRRILLLLLLKCEVEKESLFNKKNSMNKCQKHRISSIFFPWSIQCFVVLYGYLLWFDIPYFVQ